MRGWRRFLIETLFGFWLRRQKNRTLTRLKIEGLKTYLKALQVARVSAVGVVALLAVLQIMCLGLVAMVGAGIYLAPLDHELKLWLIFGAGACLFLVPFLALAYGLSGRFWYHASGADELVEKTLDRDAA